MKNSILYKVYLERIIPLIILFSAMLYILGSNEIVVYRNAETLIYFMMLAMTGSVMLRLMRSPKEHCFVNSLPVTKAQQWKCMYVAFLTMVAVVYTVYILVIYVQCHDEINNFQEIFVSGIVKACTSVFATTLMLWIISHIDFHVPIKLIIGIVMLVFGITAIGTMIQKAFNTGSNNFVYEIKNYWFLMTVPIEAFNNHVKEFGQTSYKGYTMDTKIIVTTVYLIITVILIVILANLACMNYSKLQLQKSMNKGYAIGFSKILTVAFITISVMGMLFRGVELYDKINLNIKSTEEGTYEGTPPDEYYEYLDSTAIEADKNNEVYYKGVVYENNQESYMFKYKIYHVEFPKDYLYIFMGGFVISLGVGIAAVMIPKRKAAAL